jgi:hypothetical protein
MNRFIIQGKYKSLYYYCKKNGLDIIRTKQLLEDNWLLEMGAEITDKATIKNYLKEKEKQFIKQANKK